MIRRRHDIGLVRAVNPARREIRVTAAPGAEKLFSSLGLVEVLMKDGQLLRCRVAQVRDEAGGKILALTPGVPRETVALMKGSTVQATVEVEAEVSYTFEDLDGLTVLDQAGAVIGAVTSLYAAGGNNAIEITRSDGSKLLLPVIEQVVASVDIARGQMIVKDIAPYSVEEE